MTTGHVFVGISLDGFIARQNHDLEWLTASAGSTEDHGFDAHMARMDGVVMGRRTYDVIKDMRPWHYSRPVVVLSRTLTQSDIPDDIADKVELMNATPDEAMRNFAQRGWSRVYVDGGSVIQAFLRAGLVEDMVLSRVPVLIGEGISLFAPLQVDVLLDHVSTRTFGSGLVQSTYRVRP